MSTIDHKTKDFLEKIDYLISRGVIKNQAEVVSTLNWNKSVMSSVKNGSLPVPQHIYNKFKEVYAEQLTKNPDPMSQDYREKFYQLLEKNSKLEEKIEANSKTMEGNMIHLTDLILQGQDSMVEKIGRELSQRLEELEKSLVSSLKVAPGKKPLQKGKH